MAVFYHNITAAAVAESLMITLSVLGHVLCTHCAKGPLCPQKLLEIRQFRLGAFYSAQSHARDVSMYLV